MPIIHVFSIAKHDKGEVDHVGGPAKTTIQRAIVIGEFLKNTTCMIDFFEQKYKDKTNPTYASKETDNNTIFLQTEAKFKVNIPGYGLQPVFQHHKSIS